MYQLRFLEKKDEKNYLNYINAWRDETMIPRGASLGDRTFDAFLVYLDQRKAGNAEAHLVPDHLYVLSDNDDHILGVLNLRLQLNDHLLKYDGHIGYGIHPEYRGQGLGKMIFKLGLEKCFELGIYQVLLSCNEENGRSRGVILSQGGVFENKVYKTDGYIERYWIDLKKDEKK
ncbi:MAG: GNAT family N-acetyltransferase [Acholeplasmataceae bacterium]